VPESSRCSSSCLRSSRSAARGATLAARHSRAQPHHRVRPSRCQSNAAPAQPPAGKLRARPKLQVDEVRWKLLEAADLGTTLKSKNEFIKDRRQRRSYRCAGALNLAKIFSPSLADLMDQSSRPSSHPATHFRFIPDRGIVCVGELNPKVAKTFTAIYEVRQTRGLQAQQRPEMLAMPELTSGWPK